MVPSMAQGQFVAPLDEPHPVANPLFDDATFSVNNYFFQRNRSRYDVGAGRMRTNLRHTTLQTGIEINSGYFEDHIGFDFAAFATKDLSNKGAADHEISFFPWSDPWQPDWSKADAEAGYSVYRAHVKLKSGPWWGKAGYLQPSGPGVLGVNWSIFPGTYQGVETGGRLGAMDVAAAYVTQYKAPWYKETYHFRKSDKETRVDYLWSLGGKYYFSDTHSLELAYGESQDYLKNAHLKYSYGRNFSAGRVLNMTYHLYAMRDSDGGNSANNLFDGTAYQHYLNLDYTHALWNAQAAWTYSRAPQRREQQAGYFAYRLIGTYGGAKGAYEPWWDNRSDWNHNREHAVFFRLIRRLDDFAALNGWQVGGSVVHGWGGEAYGVTQKLSERAYSVDLAYMRREGALKGTVVSIHYTHYNNRTNLPSWQGFKNAFQDERDIKFMISIPFNG